PVPPPALASPPRTPRSPYRQDPAPPLSWETAPCHLASPTSGSGTLGSVNGQLPWRAVFYATPRPAGGRPSHLNSAPPREPNSSAPSPFNLRELHPRRCPFYARRRRMPAFQLDSRPRRGRPNP